MPIDAHMLKEREFAPDVVAKAMQVNQNHFPTVARSHEEKSPSDEREAFGYGKVADATGGRTPEGVS